MNKFFSSHIKTAYPTNSQEYGLIIDEMNKFNLFETPDIMKAVNKRLPTGLNLDRDKLNDTIRVLVRLKLVSYQYGKNTDGSTSIHLKLNKG